MTAIAQGDWADQADEPQVELDSRVDATREDAYWQSVYWGEPYYRRDREYDDYAPAFCVGYIGFAQYGGTFDDAEKSLCANWFRIKGDSRLELDEALWAIRAAWLHAEQSATAPQHQPQVEDDEEESLFELASPIPARRARQPAMATA